MLKKIKIKSKNLARIVRSAIFRLWIVAIVRFVNHFLAFHPNYPPKSESYRNGRGQKEGCLFGVAAVIIDRSEIEANMNNIVPMKAKTGSSLPIFPLFSLER